MNNDEVKEWLEVRTQEALKIDPTTAKVAWWWAIVGDPYGLLPELPEEYCVGRHYFARRPGSAVWVWSGDLPSETQESLQKRFS
jgi:hypothetical protein